MKRKGILIIISGFSGAGKGTIVRKLIESNLFSLSISATTRKARVGEIEGEHYYFIEQEEFETMIENDELIEWASYCDNYYGTPRKYVNEKLKNGNDVILEIEMHGALQVRNKYPDSLLVFVTAPTAHEIKQRLIHRGTETPDIIRKRLEKSYQEIDAIDDYDYIVINDGLEESVAHIHGIIVAEHERVTRNKDIKKKFKKEFEELLKGDN
ncbi:MAG: guanylate kinase [Firmicutes bacterium HGW-Firmicutes-1]|jgi:guanylate kinase|nr:MAG: guanylate kinase [Firmicutes bacterium HGW-Firmicutes-1]